MERIRKILVSVLALTTACTMLPAAAFAQEAPAEAAEAPAEPAEAVAEAVEQAPAEPEAAAVEAILGAWILYQVFEVQEGAEPILLPKEEHESLYGSGSSIYNFDDAGVVHHIQFEAGESTDLTGTWEKTEDNVYLCSEDPESMTLVYSPEDGMLHRSFADEGRTLDLVYSRAFIGSWRVDRVQALIEGDAPQEFPREENPVLYGGDGDYIAVNPDGTAKIVTAAGEDIFETAGTWTSENPNRFVLTADGTVMEFTYFSADDLIFRDVVDETLEFPFAHVRFIYRRIANDSADAQVPQEETQTAADASQQDTQTATDTEIVYDYGYYEGDQIDWSSDYYEYEAEAPAEADPSEIPYEVDPAVLPEPAEDPAGVDPAPENPGEEVPAENSGTDYAEAPAAEAPAAEASAAEAPAAEAPAAEASAAEAPAEAAG